MNISTCYYDMHQVVQDINSKYLSYAEIFLLNFPLTLTEICLKNHSEQLKQKS